MTAPVSMTFPPELIEQIAQRAAQIAAQSQPSPDTGGYLDHAGAAEYIAANPRRLYDLVSAQVVPVYKDGSRNLYRRCDLDAYVEGRLEQ